MAASVEIQQKVNLFTPNAMFPALQNYWQPFWWHDLLSAVDDQDFQTLVQGLPDLFQDFSLDMDSLAAWTCAVKQLKSHSCRGLVAISAAELQSLPDLAIEHLASLLNGADLPPVFHCRKPRITQALDRSDQSLYSHNFTVCGAVSAVPRSWHICQQKCR